MNERIHQIAEQVYGSAATEQEIKFAELLIRECANQLDDGAEDGMWARGVLYRHFGVE